MGGRYQSFLLILKYIVYIFTYPMTTQGFDDSMLKLYASWSSKLPCNIPSSSHFIQLNRVNKTKGQRRFTLGEGRNLVYYWLRIILISSMSNRRVLSINPWFLRTKSRALCPCKKNMVLLLSNHQNYRKTSEFREIYYRKCCRCGLNLFKSLYGYAISYGTIILKCMGISNKVKICVNKFWNCGYGYVAWPANSSGTHACHSLLKGWYYLIDVIKNRTCQQLPNSSFRI